MHSSDPKRITKKEWFYSARVNHTKDAILIWRRTLLFRCIEGEIHLDISDTIQFDRSSTSRGSSGLHIRLIGARTSPRRESHFVVRVCPLWNALPLEICSLERTSLFKSRLKALYTSRFLQSFDPDNIRTWCIICPICRRPNLASQCTFIISLFIVWT